MSVKEKMKSVYEPELALIVYKKPLSHSDTYIESRKITNGKMGAAAPLSEEVITKLIKKFKPVKEYKKFIGGIIPNGLKTCELDENGVKRMIWHKPAEQRVMSFVESLLLEDGLASVPSLIYSVSNGSLSVFAVKDRTLKPKSKLYQPPFHNCSANGTVCLGSAKGKIPNNATYSDMIEYWEKLFWGSKFSHNNGATVEGNINLIWKEQVANPEKPFDNKVLKEAGLRFQNITDAKS